MPWIDRHQSLVSETRPRSFWSTYSQVPIWKGTDQECYQGNSRWSWSPNWYCNWEVYLHQRLQGYPQDLCPFIWWGWRALDRSNWNTTEGTGSGMVSSLRSKSKWYHSIIPSSGPDALTLSQCRVDGYYWKVWQEEPKQYYQELGKVQDLCNWFYYQSSYQAGCQWQAKELSAGACQAQWLERQGMVLATRHHQSNTTLVSPKCTQAPEGNSTYC